MVSRLQAASRNHGTVDAMSYQGHNVAVKCMPNWWVHDDHPTFRKNYPSALERPWFDFGIAAELQRAHYPYVCELHGIFRDETSTYVVSALASHGDLFAWAQSAPSVGLGREAVLQPLFAQLLDAVRLLHDLDVSHRDLSLENVLLTDREDDEAGLQIQLIDFGMAGLGRLHGGPGRRSPGKPFYKAPELHAGVTYDAFLADNFSLGIMLYAMALASYPWESTNVGESAQFDRACELGVATFLARRRHGLKVLPEVLSPELLRLMAGLLSVSPLERLTAGEACYAAEERASAFASPWLQPDVAGDADEREQGKPCKARGEWCAATVPKNESAASLSTTASKDDVEGSRRGVHPVGVPPAAVSLRA